MLRVRDERALSRLIAGNAPIEQKTPRRQKPQGALPEEMLTTALIAKFGARAIPQFRGSVPHRAFVLDVAFPLEKLAVEIDGWQYHGKYLADFKKDRERDRQLVLNGWRILRFAAGEVRQSTQDCVKIVEQCLEG